MEIAEQCSFDLEDTAIRVREHIIRMAGGGGCFIGASLSCVDLLVYLYKRVLRISPDTLKNDERDYLLLSKGHDVPALYGVLVELGFFSAERLGNHLTTTDSIYWHPNREIPGVEFHSGSLGHLLAVGIGVALDIKLRRGNGRVFVVVGDGELNEGSMWEGCLVAAARKLDNLIVIVDRNGFQANMRTEELVPLEPLDSKFAAFGWSVTTIDGHRFTEMEDAFAPVPIFLDRPSAVIARTVRGKGLRSLEARSDRWFVKFSDDEIALLIEELHGGRTIDLTSSTLVVR